MTISKEAALALRKPFPRESVGQLPKGGTTLDYVGHAAVTDRLLTVDPEWTWEPFALGPDGLPAVSGGNLWIKLTVCGVTRIGVGDGKNAKECIGDAIRNAAMRFGVALDLWAKENLVEFAQAAISHAPPPRPSVDDADDVSESLDLLDSLEAAARAPMTDNTRKQMFAELGKHKVSDGGQLAGINALLGTSYTSRKDLTEAHAKRVIADLKQRPIPQTFDGGAPA